MGRQSILVSGQYQTAATAAHPEKQVPPLGLPPRQAQKSAPVGDPGQPSVGMTIYVFYGRPLSWFRSLTGEHREPNQDKLGNPRAPGNIIGLLRPPT